MSWSGGRREDGMSSYKNNGVSYFVIISKLHLWDNIFLTKENNTKLVHKFSLKDQINSTNNKIFVNKRLRFTLLNALQIL